MRKRNVLLVEEEGLLRQFLKEKFRAEDYSVNTIKKPDAAISYIRRNTPNVVIADLNIPGIDDIEFVRSITGASPSTSAIVIPRDGSIKRPWTPLTQALFRTSRSPLTR